MSTKLQLASQDLKDRVSTINKKQELLKEYIAQLESLEDIDAQIKELQEQKKAIISADLECHTLETEIKELSKELTAAIKAATKETSVKPAIAKAFIKAKVKSDEDVAKVKDKGQAFSFLDTQIK